MLLLIHHIKSQVPLGLRCWGEGGGSLGSEVKLRDNRMTCQDLHPERWNLSGFGFTPALDAPPPIDGYVCPGCLLV